MIKFITALLLTIFTYSLTTAQTVYTYSDSLHAYIVSVDSIGDNDCNITTISIYSKVNNKLVQTITAPENSFFCSMKGQNFLLDDINFDGRTDFMFIQFLPAGPNIPYYYFTFIEQTKQFQRDTTLEKVTSPDFNQEQKLITSTWRASCCDHGCSTYKYINGKITLIEEYEIADDLDNPGQQITTKKKLVDGEMKIVERTIEKVEQEK